jgi:alkanesulfonate monooxygenase SsuD/methylene tetrahydromethanopterin reductase-like flavin-dependent oxidoreductase (luciferase family)
MKDNRRYWGVLTPQPATNRATDTFAIAGTPDEARERVEQLWQTADSMTLVPPLFSALDGGKIAAYQKAIADTFYRV